MRNTLIFIIGICFLGSCTISRCEYGEQYHVKTAKAGYHHYKGGRK